MSTNDGKPVVLFNLTQFAPQTCEYFGLSVSSKGLFHNDDPFDHPLPILLLELGSAILMMAILRRILKPLHQPRFIAEMLPILFNINQHMTIAPNIDTYLDSPSILQHFNGGHFYKKLFTFRQSQLMHFMEYLSYGIYGYIVGVRTDMGIMKASGKVPWMIGFPVAALPTALTYSVNILLEKFYSIKSHSVKSHHLTGICPLVSSSSFHVTSIRLDDLNLLNSEMGRLALSSSLVSSLCSFIFRIISNYKYYAEWPGLNLSVMEYAGRQSGRIILTLFIVFAVRPVMFWMISKVPEGKNIKESHFFTMVVMLFEWCKNLAYNYTVAAVMITMSAYLGKLVAAVVPMRFWGYALYPLEHTFMILQKNTSTTKGGHSYHSRHEHELRMLVCLHEEDDVFSIMNILKASYPHKKRPVEAFVLDLMELIGRENPLLINHQLRKVRSSMLNRTNRIITAFHQFEHPKGIKHQHFTVIAPDASMHNDIFVDKKIVMYWRSDCHNEIKFNVCVIFLGGPDSREALALGMRMVENPAIRLTVIRLIAEDDFITDLLETKLDVRAIFKLENLYKNDNGIQYREVIVNDGTNTMEVLHSLDDQYDLILVGRRLDIESPLVAGLADWSFVPELGIIGDILA
ncbi:cation/H(+) antiporter 14-like, partial [Camellia sinensis]|uniref:cation/H(+) antiporter 14-like n=1 Tax=Camellia sinensis TaxID=4442 RepID=UPI001036B8B6